MGMFDGLFGQIIENVDVVNFVIKVGLMLE